MVLALNNVVPAGLVFLNSITPAVPPETIENPFNRVLPSKITSAAELFIPAVTLPAGSPTAVMLVIVLKKPLLVSVPALAPVTDSDKASPLTSVPTTVKEMPLSSPADKIVTCLPEALVTVPPECKAPPITKAASSPTAATVDIPFASRATSSLMVITFTSELLISIS